MGRRRWSAGALGSGGRGSALALAQVHASLDVLAAEGLLGREPVVVSAQEAQVLGLTASPQSARLDVIDLEEGLGLAAPAILTDEAALPHEALGQVEPAKLYLPSNRSYPRDLEDPAYPRHFTTQRAYPNGVITVGQTQWYLSGCLANQLIGLVAVADGCSRVCFGPITLGLLDTRGSIRRNNRNFGLLIRMPNDARKRKSTVRRRMQD